MYRVWCDMNMVTVGYVESIEKFESDLISKGYEFKKENDEDSLIYDILNKAKSLGGVYILDEVVLGYELGELE